jgi:protein-L-isoaspartate(D-aspartate) O-methyltransferase
MKMAHYMTQNNEHKFPGQERNFPIDTPTDREQRRQLANGIRRKGITDERVIEAIERIPRHLFMPMDLQDYSYVDKAYPIGEGQTISQPFTVAYQTQLLEVKPNDKVLEIGTGSMYQACVLAAMGARVYTIERQKKLFLRSSVAEYLQTCRNIHRFYGDGYEGLIQYAPFDKILITAAAPFIPSPLVDQLKEGGIMVLPVGAGSQQVMVKLIKEEDGSVSTEQYDTFSFVPMLQGRSE